MEAPQTSSINLGISKRGSKDGYLMLFFQSRSDLGNIIQQWTDWTDPRIMIYTKFLITSITDDEIRGNIMKKLNTRLKEIDDLKVSNDKSSKEIIEACIDVLGDVTAFYDEFLGISHTISVGGS
jgi:hypothetical protein